MFSRTDGTSKMLHDVDVRSGVHIRRCRSAGRCMLSISFPGSLPQLLARHLVAAAPPGSARTIQKRLCCVGACNTLLYRRCNEQPGTGISSLGFFFTEASKCTHGHPARGRHPGKPAAAEVWCVYTIDLTVSVYGAGAPCDQPIVETISAKRSNVYFDRCLHFAGDFATEVGDVGLLSRQSGTHCQSAGVLGRPRGV